MNAKQFSLKIEEIKRNNGDMSYMDAILHYCDENKIITGLQQRVGNLPIKVIVEKEIKRDLLTGKLKLIKNEIQI